MDLLDRILNGHDPLLQGAFLVLLPLLALFIAWRPLRKVFSHWQLQRCIRRLGTARINQSKISLGEDELYVEHLVLQPDGILLLMVRPYHGNIFAAERIDKWTQVLGHRSYKFPNPLYELERDTQMLLAMLPGTTVTGMIVFGQGSRFPKGKPKRVYDFAMLKEMVKHSANKPIAEKLAAAWATLQRQAIPSPHMRHSVLSQRGDKLRMAFCIFMLCAAIGLALWQFGWHKSG